MRFTIRDLLWLTVVVALGVAWWLDRSAIEESRARATIRAAKLEDALRDSLGWNKGYEIAFTAMHWRDKVRPPIVHKEQVELPPELLEDSAAAPNSPKE